MSKIMIVEDNKNLEEELIGFLLKYGYEGKGITKFNDIISEITDYNPDLILLDVNLPYYDGYYICRELRKIINTPIIIVTSRNSEMDELMSMNLGADDFITKPYNTQILLARIASVLRRTYGNNELQEVIEHNGLKLNISIGVMEYENKSVDLTKNELKILTCLMKNKGVIVAREDLMDYMWNSDIYVDDNTLSVNITRLRKKFKEIDFDDSIETKRGLGYMMI